MVPATGPRQKGGGIHAVQSQAAQSVVDLRNLEQMQKDNIEALAQHHKNTKEIHDRIQRD